ncbi:MAG: hypothetical protein AAFN40_13765 [Cyanobacteria bacterium J06560_6]
MVLPSLSSGDAWNAYSAPFTAAPRTASHYHRYCLTQFADKQNILSLMTADDG